MTGGRRRRQIRQVGHVRIACYGRSHHEHLDSFGFHEVCLDYRLSRRDVVVRNAVRHQQGDPHGVLPAGGRRRPPAEQVLPRHPEPLGGVGLAAGDSETAYRRQERRRGVVGVEVEDEEGAGAEADGADARLGGRDVEAAEEGVGEAENVPRPVFVAVVDDARRFVQYQRNVRLLLTF